MVYSPLIYHVQPSASFMEAGGVGGAFTSTSSDTAASFCFFSPDHIEVCFGLLLSLNLFTYKTVHHMTYHIYSISVVNLGPALHSDSNV